jgi:hypothetical protein
MLQARAVARRWRGVLLMTASWALVTALGLAIMHTMTASGQRTSAQASASHTGSSPLPDYTHPLVHEQKATVAGAQALVGFPVSVPRDAALSHVSLSQAWVNRQQRQVALVLGGGKVTIMMWRATYRDPLTEYKTYIAENHVTAVIGRVNGQPALVITPDTDIPRSNPAWVEFDRGGIDVNLESSSYGTSALIGIADSMK